MTQSFRTAFRGFHKEDVVNYLEFTNNQFNIRLNEITVEVEHLQNAFANYDAMKQRCAELEAELSECKQRLENMKALEATVARLTEEAETYKNRCAELSESQSRNAAFEAVDDTLTAQELNVSFDAKDYLPPSAQDAPEALEDDIDDLHRAMEEARAALNGLDD